MVFHGFWLVSMVFQGSFMVFHGFWLVSMVFYDSRLVFHGSRLVFHGFSPECTRPKLYRGPTIQSRSAARRAAWDLVYKKKEQLKSKRFKWVCYWWRWWFPTSGWYIVHYRLWNWLKKICAHGQRDRLTGLFLQSPQLDFQKPGSRLLGAVRAWVRSTKCSSFAISPSVGCNFLPASNLSLFSPSLWSSPYFAPSPPPCPPASSKSTLEKRQTYLET